MIEIPYVEDQFPKFEASKGMLETKLKKMKESRALTKKPKTKSNLSKHKKIEKKRSFLHENSELQEQINLKKSDYKKKRKDQQYIPANSQVNQSLMQFLEELNLQKIQHQKIPLEKSENEQSAKQINDSPIINNQNMDQQYQPPEKREHISFIKKKSRKYYFCEICFYENCNLWKVSRHVQRRHPSFNLQCQKARVELQEQRALLEEEVQINPQINLSENNERPLTVEIIESIFDKKLFEYTNSTPVLRNPLQIAQKIFENCKEGIKSQIIINLASALQRIFLSQPLYNPYPIELSKQVLQLIQDLDFVRCVVSFHHQLNQIHKKIQEKTNKQSRTFKNNQNCKSKFYKMNQITFRNQHLFFNFASTLQKFARLDCQRYWKIIRKNSQYFNQLLEFPVIYEKAVHRSRVIPISFSEVNSKMQQIYQLSKQLCSDMWLVMISALRSTDLQKIKLFDTNGKPIKYLRLKEQKTGTKIQRFIPQSMIRLAIASQSQYPLTKNRLKLAIRSCLTHFKSAYGFKHRVITEIITTLAQSSNFLRFHRKASTTVDYYLDKNDEKLLNGAFKLGIDFVFNQDIETIINQRDLILDAECFPSFKFQKIPINQTSTITIDLRNESTQRVITSIADNPLNVREMTDLQDLIKEEHIGQLAYFQENYEENIADYQQYPSIELCINSIISYEHFEVVEYESLINHSQQSKQLSYVNGLADILNKNITFIEFQDQISPAAQYRVDSKEQLEKESVIITNSNNSSKDAFRIISTNQSQHFRIRKAKSNALALLNRQKFIISHRQPRCSDCTQNGIYAPLVCAPKTITCSNCSFEDQYQLPILNSGTVKFENIGKYYDNVRCPQKNNVKNNIRESMGLKFGLKNIYSKNIPELMKTNKFCFDNIKKQIQYYEKHFDYLPYEVKTSTIPAGGRGLFTSMNIKKGSLILIYNGKVGPHSDLDMLSDSLFSFGWFRFQDHWISLNIDGNQINSGARFVNTHSKRSFINLQAVGGTFQMEPIFIYVAKRDLQKGQQLFISYGQLYEMQNAKNTLA